MAYTINLTNGQALVPAPGLSDGTVDTTHSSLTLIGKNYAGYGQFLNENFVHMLENFANTTSPATPLKGQLWWDTSDNVLKVYTGTSWKISTGATASDSGNPPGDLSSLGGDLWYDTTNRQLKVSDGTGSWVTVGPASTPSTGNSGAFPALMSDTSGGSHIVIQFTISGTVYALFSKDTFTSTLSGFSTVTAGLNFSTLASPTWGISTQSVNATASTLALRTTTGALTATTFNGIAVQAQYADLAERFEADKEYDQGTVVELGGEKEITAVKNELSDNVFGVISYTAGYLMNATAGDDKTHPPIALSGRVSVKVTGKVKKGDRLVSAGDGLARSAKENEITAFNSIGRALENKDTTDTGIVKAIVVVK